MQVYMMGKEEPYNASSIREGYFKYKELIKSKKDL